MNPKELKYSKDHEWVKTEGNDSALIGITEFATDSLGDVVFIELPDIGTKITQFEKIGNPCPKIRWKFLFQILTFRKMNEFQSFFD